MPSACTGDEFRLGRWQHVRGIHQGAELRSRNEALTCRVSGAACTSSNNDSASSPHACSSWEYVNATCGPALSHARLCRAFRCRNVLIVGDSTMASLWNALTVFSSHTVRASSRAPGSPLCPAAPTQAHVLCSGLCKRLAPGGVNVSFWRHDHLLSHSPLHHLSEHHVSDEHIKCDGWTGTPLQAHPTLLLSRGAHVSEYADAERTSEAFHRRRADELIERALRPHAARLGTATVYVRAHGGALHATRREVGPLAAPEVPHTTFDWNVIPMVNEATVGRLRAAHLRGVGVVDPTRALAMRQDCRENHLHVVSALYLASTWRIIQNALLALTTSEGA